MTFLERPEGRLAIALGIGLLIGAERERRKGEGPTRAGSGIRTFAVVALLGGVAALIGSEALLVVVALLVGGIAMAGYVLGEREDPGFTTEVSLVLTYCLGALSNREPLIALAAGLVIATLLALRARLHTTVRNVLSEDELRDALLFGVAAVVVLPLIPDRTIDPLGVLNPFTLWRLVMIMAMSAVGYVAQRAIGPRYGLALADHACCARPAFSTARVAMFSRGRVQTGSIPASHRGRAPARCSRQAGGAPRGEARDSCAAASCRQARFHSPRALPCSSYSTARSSALPDRR